MSHDQIVRVDRSGVNHTIKSDHQPVYMHCMVVCIIIIIHYMAVYIYIHSVTVYTIDVHTVYIYTIKDKHIIYMYIVATRFYSIQLYQLLKEAN